MYKFSHVTSNCQTGPDRKRIKSVLLIYPWGKKRNWYSRRWAKLLFRVFNSFENNNRRYYKHSLPCEPRNTIQIPVTGRRPNDITCWVGMTSRSLPPVVTNVTYVIPCLSYIVTCYVLCAVMIRLLVKHT